MPILQFGLDSESHQRNDIFLGKIDCRLSLCSMGGYFFHSVFCQVFQEMRRFQLSQKTGAKWGTGLRRILLNAGFYDAPSMVFKGSTMQFASIDG